jgi:6-phosphogluconolactonase
MRLNITRLMNTALPLAVLLLAACTDNLNYYLGGTVTGLTSSTVLQDNDGYTTIALNVKANGAFFFNTSFPNGTAYNITVLTQPIGQICIVKNASGTGTGKVTNVVVNCSNNAPDKFAYVANYGSNDISQYAIGAGGALTAMATAAVAAGTNPNSVTVDPSGQYVYVANSGSNNISQYAIGAGGALTAMATATVAAGTNPNSVTVDALSHYAYVANEGGYNVSQYTIGAGGALTSIVTATTVAAGTNPTSIIIAP